MDIILPQYDEMLVVSKLIHRFDCYIPPSVMRFAVTIYLGCRLG